MQRACRRIFHGALITPVSFAFPRTATISTLCTVRFTNVKALGLSRWWIPPIVSWRWHSKYACMIIWSRGFLRRSRDSSMAALCIVTFGKWITLARSIPSGKRKQLPFYSTSKRPSLRYVRSMFGLLWKRLAFLQNGSKSFGSFTKIIDSLLGESKILLSGHQGYSAGMPSLTTYVCTGCGPPAT